MPDLTETVNRRNTIDPLCTKNIAMKIINAMFSKDTGGLEQAFLNYIPALKSSGNKVISVIHPKAKIRPYCPKEDLVFVSNFNQYDYLAVHKLKKLIDKEQPDCIITHSYRAAYLFNKTRTKVPKIAVCHVDAHYQFGTDAIIALTESMRAKIILSGIPAHTVFTVPNMIQIPENLAYKERGPKDKPVIGICARFVREKGIDVFIEALKILKNQKIPFKVQIAGDGIEKVFYLNLIKQYQLEADVHFLGWLNDVHAFYENIDIFCLPSREETFGLVLLEAMQHSLPLVITDLPGPRALIGEHQSARIVPANQPEALATELAELITNYALANQLAKNSYAQVFHYSTEKIGIILNDALEKICKSHQIYSSRVY